MILHLILESNNFALYLFLPVDQCEVEDLDKTKLKQKLVTTVTQMHLIESFQDSDKSFSYPSYIIKCHHKSYNLDWVTGWET